MSTLAYALFLLASHSLFVLLRTSYPPVKLLDVEIDVEVLLNAPSQIACLALSQRPQRPIGIVPIDAETP